MAVRFRIDTSRGSPNQRFLVLGVVSAAGVAACAATVAVTLSGTQSSNPALEAQVQAALVAVPIAVGLYVWYRAPWTRFAKLLVAAGFAWFLATLAQSSNEFLYSAGRVFSWLLEPLLLFLVLAFPWGRLTTQPARRMVAAIGLLVVVLYLPTALLVDSYPTPVPTSSCDADCPANAFMLVGAEPAFVGDVIAPIREAATMILLAGVITLLAARIKRGTILRRITLVPLLTVAILHALALISMLVLRRAAPDASATDVLVTIVALSYGGVALGFLAGLTSWRVFENRALRRLTTSLATHPPILSLRETSELLSEAIDPSLKVFHKPRDAPNVWLDMEGRPASPVPIDGARCVTEFSADDGHLLAIVHDAALKDTPTFLAVTRSSLLKALESERLGTELRDSLRELSESRARIMSSADRERQRIEQNLHDGAQQSLVALRIRLDLASQLLGKNPARAEQLLSELAADADAALEDVRALAQGVYPSLLADRGLSEALRATALRNPVPTTVETDGIGRYTPEIEAATYFCCLEAMQNAMKHAGGVKSISVSLAAGGDLSFEVRDDGAGFADDETGSGSGLTNMRDRLAAVGGLLTIRSAPGTGTCVCGTVPLSKNGSRPGGLGPPEAEFSRFVTPSKRQPRASARAT
jgi:signal transduction histidine kinase